MRFLFVVLILIIPAGLLAKDVTAFRGANRSGIYQATGLLKSWPEGGPKELWSIDGLGEGFSSMTIEKGRIYTTGKMGDQGYVFAIKDDGTLLWKHHYGAEFNGKGYPGARSTPTLDGDMLYVTTGLGKVLALKKTDGAKVWEMDMAAMEGAETPHFGWAESLLVRGDMVYCTPGGKGATVVALHKKTGKILWQTKGVDEPASYCSMVIFDHHGKEILLQQTKFSLIAVDPDSGELLWSEPCKAAYDVHMVSPVIEKDMIYVCDGNKTGGKGYRIKADGSGVELVWKETKLDIHHGGAVFYKGHVYGVSTGGTWMALDGMTGEVKGRFRTIGKGSVVMAEGLLYGYDERGRVALINPDPANFAVISQFEVTKGKGNHWNHPVVANGKLYLRHGDTLMCFDIKA